MKRLDTYSLTDLYRMQDQGTAALAHLTGADNAKMTDLLATIAGEIADRRGPENLAALVTGYDDDGELLDAKHQHTFARVHGRRG